MSALPLPIVASNGGAQHAKALETFLAGWHEVLRIVAKNIGVLSCRIVATGETDRGTIAACALDWARSKLLSAKLSEPFAQKVRAFFKLSGPSSSSWLSSSSTAS